MRPGIGVVEGRGSSMAPHIRDGDKVLYRCGLAPRPGDVAVFSDVVHRVVRVESGGSVWEKGERLRAWPRRRAASELQGVATAVLGEGGSRELVPLAAYSPRLWWGRAQTLLSRSPRAVRVTSLLAAVVAVAVAPARRRYAASATTQRGARSTTQVRP